MGLFRVLLAVSVFIVHVDSTGFISNLIGFGGANAVELFFVVSGFYIAMILNSSYSKNRNFYLNRALRLYPIYYIICFFVLVRCLIVPAFRTELFSYPSNLLLLGTFANLTFFGSDLLIFSHTDKLNLSYLSYDESLMPLGNM